MTPSEMEPIVAQFFNKLRYMTLSIGVSQRDCCIASFLYHFKVRILPVRDNAAVLYINYQLDALIIIYS